MATKLPSTRVGRARLRKLAGLLEADAKNKNGIKFDLGTWGKSSGTPVAMSCGTTACAMGLATISGVFKREGLHNEYHPNYGIIVPKIGRWAGLDAAMKLFEIKHREAAFLFYDESYKGATIGAAAERAVARRIRNFAAGKVSPPPSRFD